MKIQITFKSPDALDYALENLSEEEKETAKEVCKKWIEYEEYVTIEVDTEKKTAIVLPA